MANIKLIKADIDKNEDKKEGICNKLIKADIDKNEDKKVASIELIKADIDKLRDKSDQTEGVTSHNKWSFLNKRIRHWRRVDLDSLTVGHN